MAALAALAARADVTILISPEAQPVERAAAQDLASTLAKLYPREKFAVASALPKDGQFIVLTRL